jgi:hypothetical protein
LLGECKWGEEPVSRQVVRKLLEQKAAQLRQELPDGDDWTFYYAIFARAGFTETAAAELTARQGLLIDLAVLDAGLFALNHLANMGTYGRFLQPVDSPHAQR